MANERTALAWVRTGLALIAGGIALTSVAAVADLPAFLDVVAVLACLFGVVTALNALFAWQRIERAMRLGEPLPAPTALRWLVGAVVLAGWSAVYATLRHDDPATATRRTSRLTGLRQPAAGAARSTAPPRNGPRWPGSGPVSAWWWAVFWCSSHRFRTRVIVGRRDRRRCSGW